MEFNDTEYINSLFIFKDRAIKLLNKIVTENPDKYIKLYKYANFYNLNHILIY
jgi:hypothetical protein